MRKLKPKKRGCKPGVKVGLYKRRSKAANKIINGLKEALTITSVSGNTFKVGDKVTFDIPKYTPSQPLTLCGQLEDSILLLENRISNVIAKINSLM